MGNMKQFIHIGGEMKKIIVTIFLVLEKKDNLKV